MDSVVAEEAGLESGITLGSTGVVPRWTVSPWGSVTPWAVEDPPTLDWYVAADDRWHVPATESSVRQSRVEGTPVVETRLRVPDGDLVQRVWAVPDHGGAVVAEFENESPLPVAIAVTGHDVVTERAPSDVPIEGIEIPGDPIVLPIGHRSVVRIAMATPGATVPRERLAALPPALSVVRGWTRVVERASRLVLPDEGLVDAVVGARCDLLLEGPAGWSGGSDVRSGDALAGDVEFLLDVAEIVRCGDDPHAWLPDVVEPAERIARRGAKRGASVAEIADAVQALEAARLVARRAGDDRASGDLRRAIDRVRSRHGQPDSDHGRVAGFSDARRTASVGRFVREIERRIVDADGRGGGLLVPGGIPTSWLGSNFEVHSLPLSPETTVSFAVRWHGDRPAVLWEQQGEAVRLSAPEVDPDWETADQTGEALWAVPRNASQRRSSLSLTVDVEPDGGASFS